VEFSTAILCDFAQVREGLLFVSSGGITRIYHPPKNPLPRPLGLYLALVVELGPDEIERVHEVRVRVVRTSSAKEVGAVVAAFQANQQVAGAQLEPGETLSIPMAIPLGMMLLPGYGSYDVSAAADGHVSKLLTVYLKLPPPGMKFSPMGGPAPPAAPGAAPSAPNRDARRHPGGRPPRPGH
jgi:hypothetical protein